MRKVLFGIIMSLTLVISSVAASYSGVNLPDDKKKKSCCKTDKKECKEGEKKDCCKGGKKDKKSCETKTESAEPAK